MIQTCPQCGAENRDIARFCDQCSMPLVEGAVAATAAAAAPALRRGERTNWAAIGVVIAVVAGLGFLLYNPERGKATGEAQMHGGAAMPAEVLDRINEIKARLDKDSLDTEALIELYQTYGAVGKQEDVRPYLDKALAAVRAKYDDKQLDSDKAKGIVADIAQAAVMGNDAEGALSALTLFHELMPDELSVLPYLGNMCYDLGRWRDAINWYDKYLEASTPDTAQDYFGVIVDRATMRLQGYEETKDQSMLDTAVADLIGVTQSHPELFNGWYNLGHAQIAKGDKAAARKAFEDSVARTTDEMEIWRAQSEIAKLDGAAPPAPPPAHMNDIGPAKPGMPNPHGEGFGGS